MESSSELIAVASNLHNIIVLAKDETRLLAGKGAAR